MPSLWQEQMNIARRMLLVVCVVTAMVALLVGAQMVLAPDGSMLGFDTSLLSRFPGGGPDGSGFFSNWFGPGLLVLLLVFLPNAACALLAFAGQPVAHWLCGVCGGILIALCLGSIFFLFSFMEILGIAVGVLQIMTSLRCVRAHRALTV